MGLSLVAFFLFIGAIVLGFLGRPKRSVLLAVGAIVMGLFEVRMDFLGLLMVAILGFALKVALMPKRPRSLRALSMLLALIFSMGLFQHLLPGFNNLILFDRVQLSPDSVPFTMYFNYDKTLAGLLLLLILIKPQQPQSITRRDVVTAFQVLASCVAAILPLALLMGYVRMDVKIPEQSWLWALNNLFLVCFAEEALFRGVIQRGLQTFLPKAKVYSWISIVAAAVLFGASHFKGGVPYMVLASLAGIFYGYTYSRTQKVEAAMLVHFGINAIHFFLFTYPALQLS